MTYVDTNYFLRFIRNDIPRQTRFVKQLFEAGSIGKQELFTSNLVIFELYWVLTSFYQYNKGDIVSTLKDILALNFIAIPNRPTLYQAIQLYQNTSLGLEDSYHLHYARAHYASDIATFDQKLLKAFNQISKN